jgi:hypothetical protein
MRYIFLFCFLLSLHIKAQVNPGARFVAMGSTGVSLQDIWSLQQNQAGLADLKKPIAAIGYERHSAVQELSTQSALFALPYKKNVFGLSFRRYGFSAYNEQQAGFTFARKFGNTLYAALNFNYHQLKITNYGSAQTFSVEAGLQYQAADKLWLGTHIANPSRNKYGKDIDASIPVVLEFGASYLFSDKVLIATAFEKVLNSNTDFKAGAEYRLMELLYLRGGISVNPFKQYAGFGLNYQHFRLDAAASSHPALGYTPQIAMSYEF